MEIDGYFFCYIIFSHGFIPITGQLIPKELLRNVTHCDLSINVDVSCGSGEVIAVHSLYFWYHATCSGTCCNYDSSHFSVGADLTLTQTVRRVCSGRNACSVGQLDRIRDFRSAGAHEPSYVVIKYYCIPASRTTSICSNEILTSADEPLYLTNKNYPSVTTGDSTCSCSLEVFSCTSSVNLYIIEADLYLNEANCEQTIIFVDGTNTSLNKVNCANYYENTITEANFDTTYIRIDFIDDATQDQEGYFFLGFGVSEDVAFKLSCSFEQQSICRDCGVPGLIPHGRLDLTDTGNSGYGALANVFCDIGYESDSATVSCLDTGLWETLACSLKDCGIPSTIDYGVIVLDSPGKTTYLSNATVSCEAGFDKSTDYISCQASGAWTNATCIIKDCREPSAIDNGTISVDVIGKTTYLSTASVSCETGFEKSSDSISCQASGVWQNASCVIKDCRIPNTVGNGSISLDSPGKTTYLSTATVSCGAGFNRSTDSISCQASGAWTNAICVIKDCGKPNAIANGTIIVDVTGKTTYLSTASVSCDTGFDISPDSISCQASGVWQKASCVIKDCGVPDLIPYGKLYLADTSNSSYGALANVVCDNGYESDNATVSCLDIGLWETVACSRKECEDGKWGENCKRACAFCHNRTCDKFSGICNGQCKPGFKPTEYCDQECSSGWYGINCSKECSPNCKDVTLCRKTDGMCSECKLGMEGIMCERETGTIVHITGAGIAGIVVTCVVLIFISVIVTVLVMRRKLLSQRSLNTHENEAVSYASVAAADSNRSEATETDYDTLQRQSGIEHVYEQQL